jgi:hypothetical protein
MPRLEETLEASDNRAVLMPILVAVVQANTQPERVMVDHSTSPPPTTSPPTTSSPTSTT